MNVGAVFAPPRKQTQIYLVVAREYIGHDMYKKMQPEKASGSGCYFKMILQPYGICLTVLLLSNCNDHQAARLCIAVICLPTGLAEILVYCSY